MLLEMKTFATELEKIANATGALYGGLLGAAYGGTATALSKSPKKPESKKETLKRYGRGALGGAAVGGMLGGLAWNAQNPIAARREARRLFAQRQAPPPGGTVIPDIPRDAPPGVIPPVEIPMWRRSQAEINQELARARPASGSRQRGDPRSSHSGGDENANRFRNIELD